MPGVDIVAAMQTVLMEVCSRRADGQRTAAADTLSGGRVRVHCCENGEWGDDPSQAFRDSPS